MKTYISILFLAFLLWNCNKNKDNEITISGTLTDPNQQINLQNVNVRLEGQKIESGSYNANFSLLNETSTSTNGTFSFTESMEYIAKYKLIFEKDNYFISEIEINPDNINAGDDYNKTYNMYAVSYFTIRIKNDGPYNSNDRIEYYISTPIPDFDNCCTNNRIKLMGTSVDTTITCTLPGGQDITLEWDINKNNVLHHHQNQVFITPFDTTKYDLFY